MKKAKGPSASDIIFAELEALSDEERDQVAERLVSWLADNGYLDLESGSWKEGDER